MSVGEDAPRECPLCMEPLEIDDMNFFPCTCGYQICRFCWHRIRTDENGLCPACRKQYPEDPAQFQPLTEDELQRIKKERRQKDFQRKQKAAENRKHLANVRVVQKNLVFVVGLSSRLGDPEILKKYEYFGKFGRTIKVVINQSTSYAGAQGPSASAYVTYQRPEDALRAIQAVNNVYVDGRTLKASLGTTKYCSHFLRGTVCLKNDCMYLHELGEEAASFTKEEMQQGKHLEYEQMLYEQYMNTLNVTNHDAVKSKNKNSCSLSTQTKTSLEISNTSCCMPCLPDYGKNSSDIEEWPNLNVENASKNGNQVSIATPTTKNTEVPESPHGSRLKIQTHVRNVHSRTNLDVADLQECSSKSENFSTPCQSSINLLQQQLSGKSTDYLDSMSLFSSNGFSSRRFNGITISTNITDERVETPEIPDTIPVSSCTDWQAAFGFSSGAVDQQEDDLGFDPVDESARALADLLQKECNIPSSHNAGMKMISAPVKHGSPVIKHTTSPPGFSSFCPTRADDVGSKMMEFMHISEDDFSKENTHYKCEHHDQNQIFNKKDWQDGLRALLPNINISFGELPQESSCVVPAKDNHLASTINHNNSQDPSISDLWDPAIVTSWQGTNLISENCLPEDPPHWMASLQHLTEETNNHRIPILAQISDSTWAPQPQNTPPGFHQTSLSTHLPNVQKLAEGLP